MIMTMMMTLMMMTTLIIMMTLMMMTQTMPLYLIMSPVIIYCRFGAGYVGGGSVSHCREGGR